MIYEGIKEKKLIVAQHFLKYGIGGEDLKPRRIFDTWVSYFPSDFRIYKDVKLKFVDYGSYFKLEPESECPNTIQGEIDNRNERFQSVCKWIKNYINKYDMKKVEKDILRQRKHQLKILRDIYRPFNFGVVMSKTAEATTAYLAQYFIYKKDMNKTGYYFQLRDYLKQLKVQKRKNGASENL